MKTKSLVVVIAAVFAVFAIVGTALAENRVEVKVTSEPIKQAASCDKAGGISLQFDQKTILRHGDQITIDLDQYAVLCNPIDMVIAPAAAVMPRYLGGTKGAAGTGWDVTLGWRIDNITPANTTIQLEKAPVTATPQGTSTTLLDGTTGGGGVIFHIYGYAKTQRIYVDVIGVLSTADFIQVNPDEAAGSASLLTVNFFDQKTNGPLLYGALPDANSRTPENPAVHNTSTDSQYASIAKLGLWVPVGSLPTGIDYSIGASVVHNTLCVDISNPLFIQPKLEGNMDSQGDKFTFIPSNPQIAHIVGKDDIQPVACKDAKVGLINLPSGQTAGCDAIDYETSLSPYCTNTHANNRVMLKNTLPFDGSGKTEYQIRLDIISPADNVYWSNGSIGVKGYDTFTSTSCSGLSSTGVTVGSALLANGTAGTAGSASCIIADSAKVRTIISSPVKIFTGGAYGSPSNIYLYIDIPPIIYNSNVKSGDVIKVKISLQKVPCGTIYTGEITVGTFGCSTVTPTTKQTLVYPYFDLGGGWWNGMVITNLGSTDGKATIYYYEFDGDQGKSAEISVAANKQDVHLVNDHLGNMVKTAGTGTLGDSRAYVVVCTNFSADGFAMIGSSASTGADASETMGYLPRVTSLDVCK